MQFDWQLITGLWSALLVALGAADVNVHSRADECETCHASEVRQWRESRHAVAFTNGLFRAEWDKRRTAWCVTCHAPAVEEPTRVKVKDAMALQGVSCTSCHLKEGRMWSRSRGRFSPHGTLADPSFGSADYCARCHEFNFPVMDEHGMASGFTNVPMQETVSQYKASSSGAEPDGCMNCHMSGARRGHRFVGSHDRDTLRSALSVESCGGPLELGIEVSNVGAAHGVPTGGVNRHMVLRVWRSSAPEGLAEHFIGRKFAGIEDHKKRLVVDTALAAGASRAYRLSLEELGGEDTEPVNAELRYIYPLDEGAELAPGTRRYEIVWSERLSVESLAPCAGEL